MTFKSENCDGIDFYEPPHEWKLVYICPDCRRHVDVDMDSEPISYYRRYGDCPDCGGTHKCNPIKIPIWNKKG